MPKSAMGSIRTNPSIVLEELTRSPRFGSAPSQRGLRRELRCVLTPIAKRHPACNLPNASASQIGIFSKQGPDGRSVLDGSKP
jgi:hypothetical protein